MSRLQTSLLRTARSHARRTVAVAIQPCAAVVAPALAVRTHATLPAVPALHPRSSQHPRAYLAAALAALSSWLLWKHDAVAAAPVDPPSAAQPIYRALPPTTTAQERAAVAALRASLLSTPFEPALRSYLHEWAIEDDWCLLRYLRAHKLHVGHAQAGLVATGQWRMAEEVDSLRVGEFAEKYAQGLMYVSASTDPAGRAVIVNRKSPNPSVGWSDAVYRKELRSLIYTMERAIREMEGRLARGEADPSVMDCKWVFLVDMQSYNQHSATPWHVTKSFVDIMRLHYPERLHLAIIIDAPWILRSLLMLLRPVIPNVTRDKCLFITDRHSAANTALLARTIGGVEKLPQETGIPGAATRFDYRRYIDHDPLAQPRPAQATRGTAAETSMLADANTTAGGTLQKLKFW